MWELCDRCQSLGTISGDILQQWQITAAGCFLAPVPSYAGNEPFGQGAVKVGTGAASEAKAVAQPLCSQLVLLAGVLNLTSVLGPRTAQAEHVAYNRSLNAGVSLKKVKQQSVQSTLACSHLLASCRVSTVSAA